MRRAVPLPLLLPVLLPLPAHLLLLVLLAALSVVFPLLEDLLRAPLLALVSVVKFSIEVMICCVRCRIPFVSNSYVGHFRAFFVLEYLGNWLVACPFLRGSFIYQEI
jgi:hypothetical protein